MESETFHFYFSNFVLIFQQSLFFFKYKFPYFNQVHQRHRHYPKGLPCCGVKREGGGGVHRN